MEIQGAELVFKSYLMIPAVDRTRIEIQDGEKYHYSAWDDLFNMFGEGDTPEDAVNMLSEILEDYFDYIIDCSEDRIRKHRDVIVDFVSRQGRSSELCLTSQL